MTTCIYGSRFVLSLSTLQSTLYCIQLVPQHSGTSLENGLTSSVYERYEMIVNISYRNLPIYIITSNLVSRASPLLGDWGNSPGSAGHVIPKYPDFLVFQMNINYHI